MVRRTKSFGYINYAVTSASLLCGPAETAKFGGGTTPNANLACSPGDVMVGIFGTQSNVITSIGPRCQTPGSVDTTQPVGALPNNGGTPFSFTCPAGQAVTGVVGGQGAVLDSAALVCAPVAAPAFVSRWNAEGDATDAIGTNNGAVQGGAGFAAGRVGQAFNFTNAPLGGQAVHVNDDPSLQVTNAVTMAAWITRPHVRPSRIPISTAVVAILA